MLNIVWIAMIIIGFIAGIANGTVAEVTSAAFEAAGEAVTFCIGLMGIICLWCGLVKISEQAGLMEVFAKIFRPVIKKLFPEISSDDMAVSAIVMNLAADMLGLGNAATPLGINACKEIKRAENRLLGPGSKYKPTKNICLFLILNTVSVQLIPSTVIAMRAAAGSADPSKILFPVWGVSFVTCIVGIVMAKICEKLPWYKLNY